MFRHALIAAGLLVFAAAAQAQFLPRQGSGGSGAGAAAPGGAPAMGGIGSAPSAGGFSPYLNLTRGGNSAAVNYYGIVRPQMSFQNSIQTLQQQQQSSANNGIEPYDPTMPFMVVGTRARFLNTSGYFLNLNGSGATSGTGFGQSGRGSGQSQMGGPPASGLSNAVGNGTGALLGNGVPGSGGVSRGVRR